MFLIRKIFLLIISFLVLFELSFFFKNDKSFYKNNNKIWAHRCDTLNKEYKKEHNIILSHISGVKGFEVDIYWSESDFYVSHDNIIKDRFKLDLLFETIKEFDDYYLWLDFKNLQILDNIQIQKSIKRLEFLSQKYSNKSKLIIESSNPHHLGVYSKKDFYTLLGIDINQNRNIISLYLSSLKIKSFYLYYHFTALSMPYTGYSYYDKLYYDTPLYLFTINNKNEILKYINKNNIKVILSDNKNLFHIKSKEDKK